MKNMKTSPKNVIVTGGAGYIGSCTSFLLKNNGYQPIILDNFSTSQKPKHCEFPLYEVDLSNFEQTQKVWSKLPNIYAVIHFAAKALVPESCENPEMYFRNNLLSTLNSAQCAISGGTKFFIHSSSCAVYGIPKKLPIVEQSPLGPISPYGESKFINERILNNLHQYRGLKILNLRYFNPAGSLDSGRIGENHKPETHLIPNVVRAAMAKKSVPIFGSDYKTKDGTCIRDFIHIEDLAQAHINALEKLESNPSLSGKALNLGGGRETSVREVISTAEAVLGQPITIDTQPRRPGDPPILVADAQLAREALNWSPQKELKDMISSHYQFELNNRKN